ncbi:MAG: hypothetical protein ABI690_26080 [Chloroflexota bacterium]
MWRAYAFLGVLRAAVIIWLGASNSRIFAYRFYSIYIPPTPLNFLTATVSVFLLTIANLIFTAACGVCAFNKRSTIAFVRSIATRLSTIIGFSIIVVFTGWLLFRKGSDGTSDVIQYVGSHALLTLFENGVSIGSDIVMYNHNAYTVVYLPILLTSLIIYLLLTFLLLRLAQWQAVRQGALPPLTRKLSKTTYNT